MRTSYNLEEEMKRLQNLERSREEQIIIFSCCIENLRTQIKNELDIERRIHLRNNLSMLILCRKALEKSPSFKPIKY
ncbi:MAG: hypothetical protein KAJ64_04555 [Thermoplasmata archaeon]|nr:hypothetical protein [Thermoplasmata archaeon]